MEISKAKIEEAVEEILDGGNSECVVTVESRTSGKVIELSWQEWLRAGQLISERGMSGQAIWQDPIGYGDTVVEV